MMLEMPRPTWRGRMHAWTFALAVPAGAILVAASQGVAARVSAAIYAIGLLAVFGTSAAYHRLAHSPQARLVMQRLDHSMIYLLIAATYVPICVVALPSAWGVPLLGVVGTLGLIGMTRQLVAPHRAPKLANALYPIMGWAAVAAAPALADNLTAAQLTLIVAGGVAYTLGFPVLLLHRPDPWPGTFGYHEVWHVFTIVAAALHFAAIATLVA